MRYNMIKIDMNMMRYNEMGGLNMIYGGSLSLRKDSKFCLR